MHITLRTRTARAVPAGTKLVSNGREVGQVVGWLPKAEKAVVPGTLAQLREFEAEITDETLARFLAEPHLGAEYPTPPFPSIGFQFEK